VPDDFDDAQVVLPFDEVRRPIRSGNLPQGQKEELRLFCGDSMPSDAIQCKPLEVAVGDKGIERAIKHLKRKVAAEGILRELKMRRHYMKPSIKRRKKQAEAGRRRRKRAKMDAAPPKG